MKSQSASIDIASRLLSDDQRYRREDNLVLDIAHPLTTFDAVDSMDIERDFPSGGGMVDLFLPRFRTILEVKRALPEPILAARVQLER